MPPEINVPNIEPSTDERILALMELHHQQASARYEKLAELTAQMQLQQNQLIHITDKVDNLHRVVAGNGDERSLVMQTAKLKQEMEQFGRDITANRDDIRVLLAWRNKTTAIVASVVVIWTAAITAANFFLR